MHASQRGFVSAEQQLVAFSVSTALPPSSSDCASELRTRLDYQPVVHIKTCLFLLDEEEEVCQGRRMMKGMESRQLPRLRFRGGSRVTRLCGTLVGTTTKKPIQVMQAHLMHLCSIQIAPSVAWQPRWAMLRWLTQPMGAIPCGMHQPPPQCRYRIQRGRQLP